MKNNCIDSPCIYSHYQFDPFNHFWCALHNCEPPDNVDETGCNDFKLAKTCIDCKHSLQTVYETGTIDDIEYRCPFQNKKLIYDDSNCGVDHYGDVPECNIGQFELLE